MRIDMRPAAISKRLETLAELRKACLSLAKSSAGQKVLKKNTANRTVRWTSRALGR
jgi:hypothetical protein